MSADLETTTMDDSLETVNRRGALRWLGLGAASLVVASTGTAVASDEGEEAELPLVSWHDGWAYPLVGADDAGWWVVDFDGEQWAVDPTGFVFEAGIWYLICAVDADGIWYDGQDGFDYLLELDGVDTPNALTA